MGNELNYVIQGYKHYIISFLIKINRSHYLFRGKKNIHNQKNVFISFTIQPNLKIGNYYFSSVSIIFRNTTITIII